MKLTIYAISRKLARRLLNFYLRKRFKRFTANWRRPYKLHLGCGEHHLDGWINIDFQRYPGVDVVWNIKYEMPIDDNSCALIFHEHVLEHFSLEDGLVVLRQCHKKLQPGGVLRVAMPSLDAMLEHCASGTYSDIHGEHMPKFHTKAEYLNVYFRWWGHKWIYDREELHRRLREAGFSLIRDTDYHESLLPELRGLELSKDSLLVCEATRE